MRLFISYARDDKNYVYELERELRDSAFYEVWIDKRLVGADLWWDTILDEIEKADCVLAVLTPRACESIFCRAELDYALDLGKPVLPLMLKTCDLPSALKSAQFTDISNISLERALFKCSQAIGQINIRLLQGGYLPKTGVSRPSVPEPKSAEHIYEVFAEAEEAFAGNNFSLAENLFGKVVKADPQGLGIAAAERLAEIRLERDRAIAYLNVARLAANPATLKGAQAAWRFYVQKFGADHDPQTLSSKLGNLPSANPPNPVGIVGELEVKHIPAVSTPKSAPSLILPDLSTILPPPFDWCPIPAGKVTIEYGDSDHKIFDVPAFAIAKYPITNAQYQVFVDAKDGYRDSRWWDYSNEAKSWRNDNPKPFATAYPGDDLPRTRVSWYESVAFCRWLTAHLSPTFPRGGEGTGGWNAGEDQTFTIILPTEQQWQRAAQGDDNRIYPWGNDFDQTRCNTRESGTGKPTPVTNYPSGASPFDVFDLSGNVWEWCLTTRSGDSIELMGDLQRVVRGGSFNLIPDRARAACRNNFHPVNRFNYLGFRVVCRPPSP